MGAEPDETRQDGGALNNDLKRRIVRSSAWVGLGFGGGQILSFASVLVLARLLEPSAFGIVAVAMTLLAIVTQVQESGLGAALVQGRDLDPRVAAATALVFSSGAGIALTVAVVVVAPLYTHILRLPEATPYVQVLALVLAMRGLGVVPGSLLERDVNFRARARAELSGAVVQASVSIGCAVAGLGAWSLVAGQLAGSATLVAVLWTRIPFVPSPRDASIPVLREMLRFGRHVSGTNVLVIVNNNLDNISVSRFLGASSLGLYAAAWRLAEMPNTFIAVIIGRVMFSIYSQMQDDVAAVRVAYLENMQRTMLFALPVAVVLGMGAEPIVVGLLGPTWEGAVAPLRVLAVFGSLRLLLGPSGELFKGIGRPQLGLLTSLAYTCFTLPALLVLVPRHGTVGAAAALVLASVMIGAVVLPLTFRSLRLRPVELGAALARPVACAAVVAAVLFVVVPLTDGLGPLAGLLVVAAVSVIATAGSMALLARPVIVPVVAALRSR